MYSERLQILISPKQRERLNAEAQRTGTSIAAIIRDAIDARLDADRERAMEAARRLTSGPKVPIPPPEELSELLERRHDEEWDRLQRQRR